MGSATMTPLNAKVKPEEKERFSKICDEIGTTPSNAIRMFVAAFNRQGGFPFESNAFEKPQALAGSNDASKANRAQAIEAIGQVCDCFDAIDKAYLFGSLARNAYTQDSDVDIRLVLDRSRQFNLRDLAQFSKQIERLTGREVDIVSCDDIANEAVAEAIRKDGVLAYEREK